ncbi:antitoxin AF2212-like protein [Methanoregula formicica]|uniref:antitoxin AF2212-like protein n=1 Tax=Methanoregula formicica TaxID=882104 RepID=UPI000693EC53|nr:antitoxin AF2212-like protein [Methanoregula formicica]
MSAIKTNAVYKEGTLILEDRVNLPEHARVEVVIRKKFSDFVKKFGEPEAKEDIDTILAKNRRRIRDA